MDPIANSVIRLDVGRDVLAPKYKDAKRVIPKSTRAIANNIMNAVVFTVDLYSNIIRSQNDFREYIFPRFGFIGLICVDIFIFSFLLFLLLIFPFLKPRTDNLYAALKINKLKAR